MIGNRKEVSILAFGFGYLSFGDFFMSYFTGKYNEFKGNREPGVDMIRKTLEIKGELIPFIIFPVHNTSKEKNNSIILKQIYQVFEQYSGVLYYIDVLDISSIKFTMTAMDTFENKVTFPNSKQTNKNFLLLLNFPTEDFNLERIDQSIQNLLKNVLVNAGKQHIQVEQICWKTMKGVCSLLDTYFEKCSMNPQFH